jgi:hypothetical protein
MVLITVPYSERELGDALDRVHRAVGQDIDFDASLDVREGLVELFTADESAADEVRNRLEQNEDDLGFPVERVGVQGTGVASHAEG